MVQITETIQLLNAIKSMGIENTLKICRKPPLPTRILREIYDSHKDEKDLVLFVASYPLIPSDLAERMVEESENQSSKIPVALAANPRTPQPSLNLLAKHNDPQVRMALAANPNLTTREFQIVVKDEDARIRSVLAINASLPNPFQFYLATDSNDSVRAAIASRKGIDADIAVKLSQDDNPFVRSIVLANTDLSDEVRQLWCDLDNEENQNILLINLDKLPASSSESLRYSPHAGVRLRALSKAKINESEMLWLSRSDDTHDRLFLSKCSTIPIAIQRLLASDPSQKVRKRLAANLDIDETIALQIAASEEREACIVLASNDAISGKVIERLCQHPDDAVAELLTTRKDLQPVHWHQLINHRETTAAAELLAFQNIPFDEITAEVAEALSQSSTPSIQAFAARSPNLSSSRLAELSQNLAPATRLAVASNSNSPQNILLELSADKNRKIIFTAEDTLRRLRRQKL